METFRLIALFPMNSRHGLKRTNLSETIVEPNSSKKLVLK